MSYYDACAVRQWETFPKDRYSRDDADRELKQRIGDVARGIPVTSKPNMVRFSELADDVLDDYKVNRLKSYSDIEARFRLHIRPLFGMRRAAQITTSQLNHYIVRRMAETPAPRPATINRELEAIRHAFRLALDSGKILRMPKVPHLREDNVRTGFFTRDEVMRLCAALPEPYRGFTWFGFLTGWRYSEIQNLQWLNVDFQAGEIRLSPGTTKSGEGRVFPMTRELLALLLPLKKPFGYVFGKRGSPVGAFRKTWKAACRKAGLPVILSKDGKKVLKAVRTFHDMRRAAAREFQRQGFTEGQIMRMCGWATRSVFDRYAIVTNEDIREKMALLENSGGSNGGKTTIANTRTQ